jgi:hypothetical protein
MHRTLGGSDSAVVGQRLLVERLLSEAGGGLARVIEDAEAYRWISLMDARTQASEFGGQLEAYRAAPRLFRERRWQDVLSGLLPARRKYILIGVDPESLGLTVKLGEAPSIFGLPQGESKE